MPLHNQAPRDWPAWPVSLAWIVLRGRPASPKRLDTSWLRVVPTALWVFCTSISRYTGSTSSRLPTSADRHMGMRCTSKPVSRPWSCLLTQYCMAPGRRLPAGSSSLDRSMPASLGLELMTSLSISSMSARPTMSSTLAKPREAMISRISSATMKKKLMTLSGSPANLARSTGSWVAMPTGQVLVWHLRIMMQPIVISGAVEKPYSSAPSRVAMATSRPVRSCPSTCRVERPRRSLATSVWCVSAIPSSQGRPACLMLLHLAAPVPPSWPLISTWSAWPFTTPEATTPTPFSDTSFTDTRALGLLDFKS
mmetsp:Transcript_4606/g.12576  ORF Transcript_4606/g.12576 Transcript_4606/m.12576 type:complete len:309 (+) Transcript_4606:2957-3883(+)